MRSYRERNEERGIEELKSALRELSEQGDPAVREARLFLEGHLPDVVSALHDDDWSEIESLAERSVTRADEAIPLQPLATTSVTEDMATSVRLHSLGWKSVYHSETLAYGLAPEDLGTALKQRLRWAQGTVQVLLREKPLSREGLTLPQRIQYLTTIYSYFSGFASVIFLAMPIIYLFTGLAPVNAWTAEFLWRLVPYLLVSRLLFKMFALGTRIRRGEQYSLGLFPLWIRAVVGALFGKKLSFAVTSKTRQSGTYLRMVRPQLLVILLSGAGVIYGAYGLANGWQLNTAGVLVNIFWAVYNIVLLSAIVRAAVYRPPAGFRPLPPAEVRGWTK